MLLRAILNLQAGTLPCSTANLMIMTSHTRTATAAQLQSTTLWFSAMSQQWSLRLTPSLSHRSSDLAEDHNVMIYHHAANDNPWQPSGQNAPCG